MCLSTLIRGHSTDHVSPVFQSLFNMESSLQQTRKKKKSELTLIGLMIQISLYRLSCQALTQHSGIFMNEEVLNGIGIAVSSGSLRERPASDF